MGFANKRLDLAFILRREGMSWPSSAQISRELMKRTAKRNLHLVQKSLTSAKMSFASFPRDGAITEIN